MPEQVLTKRCLFLELRAFSNVLRGHPMFFKSLTGTIAVLIISADQFVDHSDLPSWLKNCDLKDLHGNNAVLLNKGEAIFLPPGFVPVWLALPTDVDLFKARPALAERGRKAAKDGKQKKELLSETHAVGINLVHETTGVNDIPEPVRRGLALVTTVGKQFYPKKLLKLAGEQDWLDSLAVAADGEGDVALDA